MENCEYTKLESKLEADSFLKKRGELYLQAQGLEMEDEKKKAIKVYRSLVAMGDSYAFDRISSIFAIHLLCVKALGVKCQLEPKELLEYCKEKSARFPEEAFKAVFMLLDLNVITEDVEKYQLFLKSNDHTVAQLYWNKLQQKEEK